MTAKQLMMDTFAGKKTGRIPVCPHWYGAYKYKIGGLAETYEGVEEICLYGDQLAELDELFYRTFIPDWMHLSTSHTDHFPARFSSPENARILKALRSFQSTGDIEDYIAFTNLTKEEIRATGLYEHVPRIVQRYGDETYIIINEGNPICGVLDPHGPFGFETGLQALLVFPDYMEYLIWRMYEQHLDRMRFLAETGVHGYLGSETYCGADLISPAMYRSVIFPAQKMFYHELSRTGIEPLIYFLGDILPLLDDINNLEITALLIEESKKTFHLDPLEIRRRLDPSITLFGNIDSLDILQNGTVDDVRRETIHQMEAAKYGPFVVANGSPLTIETPPENLIAMIETGHTARDS